MSIRIGLFSPRANIFTSINGLDRFIMNDKGRYVFHGLRGVTNSGVPSVMTQAGRMACRGEAKGFIDICSNAKKLKKFTHNFLISERKSEKKPQDISKKERANKHKVEMRDFVSKELKILGPYSKFANMSAYIKALNSAKNLASA